MTYCKQCTFPIRYENCDHMDCNMVYASGFCSKGCRDFYLEEKQFEINRMENQANA